MEQADTRTKIMVTALDLFSRNGFNTTTTRSIATETGVNELTIFRIFGTKENLLSQVIDHSFDPNGMQEHIPSELTGDIDEDLFRIIMAARENIVGREKLFRLMLREVTTNELVARKLSSLPQLMKDFMILRIQEALEGSVRDDIDIETAGVFLASYVIRSEIMKIMVGEDPFHDVDEKRTREAIEIFLRGALKEGVK